MKNLKLLVLMTFVLNLITVSCSSDDDNDTDSVIENVMFIDGDQFNIEVGLLEEYGENDDGSFDWDVILLSEEFNINTPNGTSPTIAYIYLDLNTNSSSGLVPGTYTFADERAEFTLVDAEGVIDFIAETEDGIFFDVVSGTVIITGTGDSQVIEASLVDQNGNPMTATFGGTLQSL